MLTFDQPVQAGEGLNSVAVTGPDGKEWQGGSATVDSNVVTAPVRELGPKGVYTIGYRIVSADGHPVSGKLTFTLTREGNGTPAPVSANTNTARPGRADSRWPAHLGVARSARPYCSAPGCSWHCASAASSPNDQKA